MRPAALAEATAARVVPARRARCAGRATSPSSATAARSRRVRRPDRRAGRLVGVPATAGRTRPGIERAWWFHRAGCRRWFQAERDTRDQRSDPRRLDAATPGQPGDGRWLTRRLPGPGGRRAAPRRADRVPVRRAVGTRDSTATRSPRRWPRTASTSCRGASSTTGRAGCCAAAGRCPNCLVEVDGEPNVRACVTPIARGDATVRSQNAWPSLRCDLFSLTDRFDRFLPIGFYYKTFIRPRRLWPLYEGVLRRVAGLGRVDVTARPDLAPAQAPSPCRRRRSSAAGRPAASRRSRPRPPGRGSCWSTTGSRLGGHLRTRLRRRRRATSGSRGLPGHRGGGAPGGAGRGRAPDRAPRRRHGDRDLRGRARRRSPRGRRFVRVLRARRIVLATGAAERPALFDANDRPGIMLASGILRLAHLHGVRGRGARGRGDRRRSRLAPGRRAHRRRDRGRRGHRHARPTAAAEPPEAADGQRRPAPRCWLAPPSSRPRVARACPVCASGPPMGRRGRSRLISSRWRRGPSRSSRLAAQAGLALRLRGAPGRVDPGRRLGRRRRHGPHDRARRRRPDRRGRACSPAASPPAGPRWTPAEAAARAPRGARGSGVRGAPRPAASSCPVRAQAFVCLCEDVTPRSSPRASARGSSRSRRSSATAPSRWGRARASSATATPPASTAAIRGASRAATGLTTYRPPVQPVPLAVLAGPHLIPVRRTALHDRHDAAGRDLDGHGRLEAPAPLRRRRRRVPRGPRGRRPHRRVARWASSTCAGRDAGDVPRLAPSEPVQRPAGRTDPLPGDDRRRRHHPRRRDRRPARATSASSSRPGPAASMPSTGGCAGGWPRRTGAST